MDILAYNPSHDGAVALLREGHLAFSIEAEKDSDYRHSPIGSRELLDVLGHLDRVPDVIGTGGWWPPDGAVRDAAPFAGYRGISDSDVVVGEQNFLGKTVRTFTSSHERSHLLCAYGMSPFAQGEPCYALIWEGEIGSFYEFGSDVGIKLIGEVMREPGHRYASIYGLADPTFPKDAPFTRLADAGKLMALASFGRSRQPSSAEIELMDFLLNEEHVQLDRFAGIESSAHYNVGVEDPGFRDFAAIFSDRIFDAFHDFARANLRRGRPLLIAGGCGLNCDWNTRWLETDLFSEIFVPPVANDSGSAIGTAVDAQLHFTGNAKIEWDVYSGLPFDSTSSVVQDRYDVTVVDADEIAAMLDGGMILGWAHGRYEIGPRALGNRSILASPFEDATRVRLNEIKQREQFRPIAPVCLEEDAKRWFGCDRESPFMLYTFQVQTDDLAAVTHVNGTARLQTVSESTNPPLHALLTAFRSRTGYGVLCNTSLNFHGRGFINRLDDLDTYTSEHSLDGFVADGRVYLRRSSVEYISYRQSRG